VNINISIGFPSARFICLCTLCLNWQIPFRSGFRWSVQLWRRKTKPRMSRDITCMKALENSSRNHFAKLANRLRRWMKVTVLVYPMESTTEDVRKSRNCHRFLSSWNAFAIWNRVSLNDTPIEGNFFHGFCSAILKTNPWSTKRLSENAPVDLQQKRYHRQKYFVGVFKLFVC